MTARWVALGVLASLTVACTADSRGGSRGNEREGTTRAAIGALPPQLGTQRLSWGEGRNQLGFRPAFRESLPLGAPAVAVGPGGRVLVLDALNERVVLAQNGELVHLAKVPVDSDDLAVSGDGAFAVRRGTRPEVLVFAPSGDRVGSVDTRAIAEVDRIAIGTSRRVFVTNSFQETFLVGSPSVPQLGAAILSNKREGAVLLADGSGVVAVKSEDGIELRVVGNGERGEQDQGKRIVKRVALGKGDAASIVGESRGVVCARIEHTSADETGAVAVQREAACVDVASGKTVLRRDLPAPGAYLPRRELSFAGTTLAFARATADGLEVTTWGVDVPSVATPFGGAR